MKTPCLTTLLVVVLAGGMDPRAAAQLPGAISPPGLVNTDGMSDANSDQEVSLAAAGGTWIAVWTSRTASFPPTSRIMASRSIDRGQTWSDPLVLHVVAAVEFPGNRAPTVANIGDGQWVAAWENLTDLGTPTGFDLDLLYCRSGDDGVTWTFPASLNRNAATDSGMDSAPRIAGMGGSAVAVWSSNEPLGGTIGTEGDILFARTTDGGVSWSLPQALNTTAATDGATVDTEVAVATPGSGVYYAVWSSNGIVSARSTDNGQTWSPPAPVSSDPDDRSPAIAADALGHAVVAWERRDLLPGGDTDLFASHSTDGATSWSPAVPVNAGGGDGVDDVHVRLACSGLGRWVATWESRLGNDEDILIAGSIDGGETWTGGVVNADAAGDFASDKAPDIAIDQASQGVVAWTSNRRGSGIGAERDIFSARFALPDCNGNFISDAAELDADRDGVIDGCDACPADPRKSTEGPCGCGRTDADGDGDGWLDCLDNCPSVANPDQADSDGDGIGDACAAPGPQPMPGCGIPPCGSGLPVLGACLSVRLFSGRWRRWRRRRE
jgi:hypothetical protein